MGVNKEDAVKMASTLGGGVGRNGHICGAVSDAALIIGMKFGSTDPADFQVKEKAYNKNTTCSGQKNRNNYMYSSDKGENT